jgi:hypothetical protein
MYLLWHDVVPAKVLCLVTPLGAHRLHRERAAGPGMQQQHMWRAVVILCMCSAAVIGTMNAGLFNAVGCNPFC